MPRDLNSDGNEDLIAALAGQEANRDRFVAHRTRRVLSSSLGLMNEQKAGRKRARALGLAGFVLAILLTAPLAWETAERFIAGEHLGDLSCQLSLWACIACPTMLAAALVAGWMRNR